MNKAINAICVRYLLVYIFAQTVGVKIHFIFIVALASEILSVLHVQLPVLVFHPIFLLGQAHGVHNEDYVLLVCI